ncbi:MAG: hypothetical protein AAF938_01860 [Myxococcota bacterium]
MMLRSLLVLACAWATACGDNDGGTDSGATDAATEVAMDVGGDERALEDTGASDAADTGAVDAASEVSVDAAMDAATDAAMDAGPVEVPTCGPGVEEPCCFDISLTLGDLPFVIEDTFDASTPTWMRPQDMCPAEATSAEALPFVAYTYCNKGDTTADFEFEGLDADEDKDELPMILVAYSGAVVPEDVRMCGAFAEPIFGAAELVLTMDPGEVVTIVTTLGAPGQGTVQSVAGEPTDE